MNIVFEKKVELIHYYSQEKIFYVCNLLMKYEEGLPAEQIALSLRMNQGTIRNLCVKMCEEFILQRIPFDSRFRLNPNTKQRTITIINIIKELMTKIQ